MAEPIKVNVNGVGTVNFPADYTPDRIKFVIENDILPRVKPTNAAPKLEVIDNTIPQTEKPSAMVRLGRGVADVTEGIGQAARYVGEALGAVPEGTADAYTREKTADLKTYEQARGKDAGIDWMRLVGNAAATLPAAAIPGGAAAGLGTRMASAAAQGGLSSASMFTPEGESKITQTLVGAGFGAAVPAAITGIKTALTSIADKFKAAPAIDLPALKGELTLQLQQHGIDFGRLTGDVQKSLLDDATRAVQIGGKLDAESLARKADIEAIGAKPTQASVTRDPRAWQTEKNLRGIQGVGDPIVKREQENATAMIDYLAKLRAQSGGKAGTAYEAGQSAVGAIRSQDAAKKQVVDGLYDAYRSMGVSDVGVPDTKIADTLGRVADEIGVENIPAAVMNRLKEFGLMGGTRTKLLTINEADKLNRLINNNNPGAGTPGARALQPIKQALDEALLDVPESVLPASDMLRMARSAAAQRFAEQRAGSGIKAAVDDVAPDRFVKKFILDADVREMRGTLAELRKSPQGQQAISDIKGHLFDNLLMKATGATSLDDIPGRFSGATFSKALDAIAPEKLHQIFTPSELESLRTLQRASKYLTQEVPFSDVNYSKTSAALANILLKVGNTPFVGKMLAPVIGAGKIGVDWVKDANARKQVAEALLGSAASAGQKAPAAPVSVNQLERFVPGIAGAVGYEASQ